MNAMGQFPTLDRVLSEDEARAQIARASGRLRHRWLWDDIDVKDWLAALRSFERVARNIFCSQPAEGLEGKPETVGIAAYTSGMGPLLGLWVSEGRIDTTPEVAAVLTAQLDHNRARMRKAEDRTLGVVEALADRGIRPLVMKGMHTALQYFPEPGARPLSDIDLLIRRDEYRRACEALRELALAPGPRSKFPEEVSWTEPAARALPMTLRYLHKDDPLPVDVHLSLDRKCTHGAPVISLGECGLEHSTVDWAMSPAAGQMNPSALALYLLVHASCGLECLTLLRVCELVLVARGDADTAPDWSLVKAMAGRSGALAAMFPAVAMLDMLDPGLLPRDLVEASAYAAPRSVHRQIRRLTPGTAQRVIRTSLSERFMWTLTPKGIVRHLWEYATLGGIPAEQRAALLRYRAGRVIRMLGAR
jgi:hypothetical protein